MYKKIKNIFFLSSFILFLFFTINIYFSDENIRKTNKKRSFYSVKSNINLSNLPLLKNDTNDIIEYKNDIEVFKEKKKKYKIFELLN